MSFDLKIKNGDIAIAKTGDVSVVFDNEKLRQDIIKILLTKLGENKYHAYYGSALGFLEIGSVPDADLIEADLSRLTEEAIGVLIKMQMTQMKKQYVSPGEIIIDIVSVDVFRDVSDPRGYNVNISVLTRRMTVVQETLTVRLL